MSYVIKSNKKYAYDPKKYGDPYLVDDNYLESSTNGNYYQSRSGKIQPTDNQKMLAQKLGIHINKLIKKEEEKRK